MKNFMKTFAIVFGAIFAFYGLMGIGWMFKGVFTNDALMIITVTGLLACIFTIAYVIIPKSKKPEYVIDEEFYANQAKNN